MRLSGTQIHDAIHRGEVEKVLGHVQEIERELASAQSENLRAAQQVESLESRLKDAQNACDSLTNDWHAALAKIERLEAAVNRDAPDPTEIHKQKLSITDAPAPEAPAVERPLRECPACGLTTIRLSPEDQAAFLAALDRPPKPNAKLQKLLRDEP